MKQFVVIALAIMLLASCAGAGAGGGDTTTVNGYIPLVAGKAPNGARSISFVPNAISEAEIEYYMVVPVVYNWSASAEPVSDGETFEYTFFGKPLVLTANITILEAVGDPEDEDYQPESAIITYTGNIDNDSACSVMASINMRTMQVNSSNHLEILYTFDGFRIRSISDIVLQGTYSESGYSMKSYPDEETNYYVKYRQIGVLDENGNYTYPNEINEDRKTGKITYLNYSDFSGYETTQGNCYFYKLPASSSPSTFYATNTAPAEWSAWF